MDSTRRDFLKSSGLVIMGGAAGFLTADQFVYGQDNPFSLGKAKANIPQTGPEKELSPAEAKALAEKQRPTLVTIFLRGGADSLNAFVPYGDPGYYKLRPQIGLTEKGKAGAPDLVKIKNDPYWALNPGLAPCCL